MPCFTGFYISRDPADDAIVIRLGREFVLFGVVFKPLRRLSGDRGHREVRISNTGPLSGPGNRKRSLVIRIEGEIRAAPPVFSIACVSDRFWLGMIKAVMNDRLITQACADKKLCIRNWLAIVREFYGKVSDIIVGTKNEALYDGNPVCVGQRKIDLL